MTRLAGYNVVGTSPEYYTPLRYIVAVREVLREIDLDPASCEEANRIVQAREFYTVRDNGLLLPWYKRVFLNPPYGKVDNISEQDRWTAKLIYEFLRGNVCEAIALTSSTDTSSKWYQRLMYFPHCITDHRIKFIRPGNAGASRAMAGSLFTYFGRYSENFFEVFEEFGACFAPCVNKSGASLFDEVWQIASKNPLTNC